MTKGASSVWDKPISWSAAESPFHHGELSIQERYGVTSRIDQFARRAMQDFMPDDHRAFLRARDFLVAGVVDAEGQPWTTIFCSAPGFIETPDGRQVMVPMRPKPGDPAGSGFKVGAKISLLSIDFDTRERFRTNGSLSNVEPGGITVAVDLSFASCPQYIQKRQHKPSRSGEGSPVGGTSNEYLDAEALALIAKADTFFISSAHLDGDQVVSRGVDVSHRGGKPGFVRADDARTLTMPDFVGNMMFNTLGNLLVEPRAGLLFVDFATGDTLQLAVRTEIVWDHAEVRAFAGAERLLRFHVARAILSKATVPFDWSAPELSPVLRRTGSWDDAQRTIEAEALRETWRAFRIKGAVRESRDIRSFILEPMEGGVDPFEPGQHLPIRVPCGASGEMEVRIYTLSAAPNGKSYRISVKADGLVSGWLHGQRPDGDIIEAKSPRGEFYYRPSTRPAMLISAGVGVTPMIAMLDALLVNNGRTRHFAPIIFVHGARDGASQPFAAWLREKSEQHANLQVHVRFSQPKVDDVFGRDFHDRGRVDTDLVGRLRPADDCDVYLCGPPDFMQSIYDGLRDLGTPDSRIHSEAFGPSSLRRRADNPDAGPPLPVRFHRSGIEAGWRGADGTLLQLAEAKGLTPANRCRVGSCGTCITRVLEGDVHYASTPVADIPEGTALLCCGVPAPGSTTALVLDL